MSEAQRDPLKRIRTLYSFLPIVAVMLIPLIPLAYWAMFGFIAMEFDVREWVGEGRFAFCFISIASWLLTVVALKDFCQKKLKYDQKRY